MSIPLVSIAIATYNGERFLRKQLDSIYAQSYNNIEVIACDDCSVDSTVSILEEYSVMYGLKYYENNRNLGYVKNFERLIELCTGEFIALSDQDDIWVPHKIETMLKHFDQGTMVIHSDAILSGEYDEVLEKSYSEASQKVVTPESYIDLIFNGCVTGCTCMMRADFKRDLLPFPEEINVHDRWIGLLAYSRMGLKYLPDKLIYYRQHNNNNLGANINFGKKNRNIAFDLFFRKRKDALFFHCVGNWGVSKTIKDRFASKLGFSQKLKVSLSYYIWKNLSFKRCTLFGLLLLPIFTTYFEKNKSINLKVKIYISFIFRGFRKCAGLLE